MTVVVVVFPHNNKRKKKMKRYLPRDSELPLVVVPIAYVQQLLLERKGLEGKKSLLLLFDDFYTHTE